MAIFASNKCPNGHEITDRKQQFCSVCGVPVGGGSVRCGVCKQVNTVSDTFCVKCGQPLSQSAAPVVEGNRWRLTNEEFAARIEPGDLNGILKRGLYIEAGTNAMILESGANIGIVPPGSYVLETFLDKLKGWVSKDLPKRSTALLVKVTPTDLPFRIDKLFSKDPLHVAVDILLQVEVDDPGKFLINVLGSRERFSVQALRDYLYVEVQSFTSMWMKQYTVDQLSEDASLREKYELAITEELKTTLQQSGLKILQLRALNFVLEIVDQLSGQKHDYILKASEARVMLEGEKTLEDAKREFDLLDIVRMTNVVEDAERKNAVYARMRDAANSNRIDRVTSEQEYKDFIDRMNRDKVLDEEEYRRVLRTWAEADQDHETARELLLQTVAIENEFQLDVLDLKRKHELSKEQQTASFDIRSTAQTDQNLLDAAQLASDIERAEKIRDHNHETQRKNLLEAISNRREREKLAEERANLRRENYRLTSEMERDQTRQDADMGLKILENLKAIKRLDLEEQKRIDREDVLARERDRFIRELERNATERRHELDLMERKARMTTEQLISVSTGQQAAYLADIAKQHIQAGMTEEQILAQDPKSAEVLREKYSAQHQAELLRQEQMNMSERLEDHQEWSEKIEKMADKRVQDLLDQANRQQQTIEKSIDRTADAAEAIAKKPDGSTVIMGGPGHLHGAVVHGVAGGVYADGMKECQSCGRKTTIDARFCVGCGTKFADIP